MGFEPMTIVTARVTSQLRRSPSLLYSELYHLKVDVGMLNTGKNY